MNTVRYKPEYKEAALELIRQSTNMVCCPSEIYFDIARTAASTEPDVDKLNKLLFGKTYTVISVENGELLGLASMDKDGNIGLLFAREGKTYTKAAKALLRALERRAFKQNISHLYALKTDESGAFLRKCGYQPFDNESGGEDAVNEYQLVKKISVDYGAEFTFDMARKITLDPTKPIKTEGRASVAPTLIFGLACFFIVLLVIFTVVNVVDGTFERSFRGLVMLYFVTGLLFIVGTALMIVRRVREVRIKKEVLSMNVTNAVIIDLSTSTDYVSNSRYRNDGGRRYNSVVYISFSYVYIDGNMKRCIGRFSSRYDRAAPYFYRGQELVVAYSDSKTYVLRDYTESKRETLDGKVVNDADEEIACEITAPRGFDDLSKYVPMYAAKRSGRYCKTSAVVFASLLALILLIFFVVSLKNAKPFWEDVLVALPFVLILFIAVGIPMIRFTIMIERAKRRFAAIVETDYEIAAGKLICTVKTYKSGNKNKFMCVYKNAKGKEQIIDLPKLYVNEMIETGNTAVTVVYNDETAEVLVRKGKFPDN